MKLAAAPISWGVSEVPDWGVQLPPGRVLADMSRLGLEATEAGPPGFLPPDPGDTRRLLTANGLRLVGGFVTAVLHDRAIRASELASAERKARWLADGGAEVLVLAAATGRPGYSAGEELSEEEWRALIDGIDRVAEVASRRGLAVAVHPHFGTAIERPRHVERLLERSAHPLCLDTGHLALGGADPVAVARDAGPRVRHVHLKDVDARLAAQVREGTLAYAQGVRQGLYVALGEGAARVREVLALLRATGYAGWYVLEQDVMLDRTPEDGPPAWIERSLAFAKRHA